MNRPGLVITCEHGGNHIPAAYRQYKTLTDIAPGEAVGFVGESGSGKSFLPDGRE